jgi:peptidoglycan/xylan/chitin deacetylase (PgdA/CDA1 family)
MMAGAERESRRQSGRNRQAVTVSPRPAILCFHAVGSTWPSPLATVESALESRVAYFRRRGYIGFTLAEAERRRSDGSLPRRSLVVTFDDGYKSTLRAVPILRRLGVPATVFVVTSFVGSKEPMRWRGIAHWSGTPHREELVSLNWDELAALREAGWEVGSHTVTHPILPALAPLTLEMELVESRSEISERLGSCETIAYPYGKADARVAAAARSAGYLAGCTLTYSHRLDEPHLRPRLAVDGGDTPLRAWLKTSRAGIAARRSPIAWVVVQLGIARSARGSDPE